MASTSTRNVVLIVAVLATVMAQVVAGSSFSVFDGGCSESSPCPNSGHCCSQFNFCGDGPDYCGEGCKNGPCTGTEEGGCSESSPCPNGADCCSQFNFCGQGPDYCGEGCKNGPCSGGGGGGDTPPSGGGAEWQSFFTKSVFEGWFPNRRRDFYTYEHFTAAATAYPAFGTTGGEDDQKREIAAFFGNVQQESGGLQFVEEIDGASRDYCDEGNRQYPCAWGKMYFGRGPIQLSWNYNYGECGDDLNLDLLANPDQVAQNGAIAFETALWFWMKRDCHGAIVRNPPSFAKTIDIINGAIECRHGHDDRVESRVNAYTRFCSSLGVNPGTDLRC